jgi:hypothetical protein
VKPARAAAGLALSLWAAGVLAAPRSSKETVEQLLKAYNRHDAEAAAATFQAEAEIWKPGSEKPEASGRDGIRQFFADQFREHPKIHSEITQRIELGTWIAVREKTTPEPGEPSRDALLVFDAPEGAIRRAWTMKADDPDDEMSSEGPVGLQIERWNERDLPRLLATYDERATVSRLSTGERLAAGEDALRDRFEKEFEGGPSERIEVPRRMALGPWVVYLQRIAPPRRGGSGETIVVYEVRDNVIRRVWLVP